MILRKVYDAVFRIFNDDKRRFDVDHMEMHMGSLKFKCTQCEYVLTACTIDGYVPKFDGIDDCSGISQKISENIWSLGGAVPRHTCKKDVHAVYHHAIYAIVRYGKDLPYYMDQAVRDCMIGDEKGHKEVCDRDHIAMRILMVYNDLFFGTRMWRNKLIKNWTNQSKRMRNVKTHFPNVSVWTTETMASSSVDCISVYAWTTAIDDVFVLACSQTSTSYCPIVAIYLINDVTHRPKQRDVMLYHLVTNLRDKGARTVVYCTPDAVRLCNDAALSRMGKFITLGAINMMILKSIKLGNDDKDILFRKVHHWSKWEMTISDCMYARSMNLTSFQTFLSRNDDHDNVHWGTRIQSLLYEYSHAKNKMRLSDIDLCIDRVGDDVIHRSMCHILNVPPPFCHHRITKMMIKREIGSKHDK